MASVVLLVVGVAGAIVRPRGAPVWLAPTVAAAAGLALGTAPHPDTLLRPLAAPIAFLLVAVPLAARLDRLGFFVAAAEVFGRGRHLALGLWVLGALVTTILNLDAAVVLLTPLYVRIARRCGLDPLAVAFQPVLLSCLASSALPVSNLGPLVLITGTLAALLWQASLRRLDVRVGAAQFARVGARVMIPALIAAFAALIALRPLVGR